MTAVARARTTIRGAGALGAALAFAIAASGEAIHASRCPHHRGTTLRAALHAAPETPASHGHAGAQPDAHEPESREHAGPCTCLGDCEGTPRVALPALAFRAQSSPQAPVERLPTPNAAPDSRPIPFTLPFANAPPLRA